MKKCLLLISIILFITSCSTYNVKKDLKSGSSLSKFKTTGIIFRVANSSPIDRKRYKESILHWFGAYKKINNLQVIDVSDNLGLFMTDYERFYQISPSEVFLHYKSTGVITEYFNRNKEEFQKLISENNLDSLIIYEIDSTLSIEMQFMEFKSMIVIADPNFKVCYMDHQENNYDINEIDPDRIKNHLLDEISNRFFEIMDSLDYVDSI